MHHYVYILKCADDTYYTGIAKNLRKRIEEHKNAESKSTSPRLPIKLIWFCAFTDQILAAKFEIYLKSHSGRRFRERFILK
ncbi:MAG: GIY-YIG nuclease family protein [Candidatus Magasanikbacteria bacterium]|nr:GIY-YIG nuclease family protein [Candidatus Magasanikbacteria bacterium]